MSSDLPIRLISLWPPYYRVTDTYFEAGGFVVALGGIERGRFFPLLTGSTKFVRICLGQNEIFKIYFLYCLEVFRRRIFI